MVEEKPNDGESGLPSIWEYDILDPEADSLLDRVKFLKLFGLIIRSWVLALASFVSGLLMIPGELLSDYRDQMVESVDTVQTALTGSMKEATESANEVALEALSPLGVSSLPVSQAIILAGILLVVITIAVFVWGDFGE